LYDQQGGGLKIVVYADSSGSDPTTIFVKGFDKYQGEEDVRQALTEVFQDCGAIASVRLPTDRETQELKGIAFIQFEAPEGKVNLHHIYSLWPPSKASPQGMENRSPIDELSSQQSGPFCPVLPEGH